MSFLPSDRGVVKIDLSSISNNFSRLYGLMRPGNGRLMPVIKSDAYGHGIKWVAHELKDKPVWGFGIYECSEARLLRDSGIENPLFLLSGLLQDQPETVLELGLTVGVVKTGELFSLDQVGRANGKKIPVHLKVDTGMGRFGLDPGEVIEISRKRKRWPNLYFEGLYTHLSAADTPEDPYNKRQIEIFVHVLGAVRGSGWHPEFIHMANSSAIMFLPEARFNLARPGIALYGAICPEKGGSLELRPAMGFFSKLIQIRRFQVGASLSYGHHFTCDKDSVIGLVPVGYDNGYPRVLSNKASVLIGGKRYPVVGNICMKAFLVDLTGGQDLYEGQEVILLGSSGQDEIHICELAQKAGTISYELLCLLGKLNKRVILR